ncbi:MAG: CoB--CoM heterodisulfide reductase iron-sulfur subunit B family protein [Candidatus Delongbacteria bacterium]|nr:CoB--CoM heterodisulfide reductase iron-sulfur subunit B family protein [Candidatus Delongbacteria bacterium]
MKIPYFPGCTLKTTAKNFEISAIEAGKKIGIEMVEMPKWNCCGVVSSLTSDDLMKHVAPVRNFVHAEEMSEKGTVNDSRMLILCSMCFNTMKNTNRRVKNNAEDMKSINDFMYLEKDYEGKVEVVHYFELLKEIGFDKIAEKVTKSLKDMKIAPYYGCMLLRPKEIGIDNAEAPAIIEDFITSVGAEPVNWDAKGRCCGSYHTVNNKDIVVNLAKGIIENAHRSGADAIITSCPLCAFNLDNRQKLIMEKDPNFKTMPVFYFTQLLALALGLEEKFIGLEDHYIDPKELLKNKNLI